MAGHACPAPGCERVVPSSMLACRGHWFALPPALRDRVWREYRAMPGSAEHMAAVTDAVAFLRGDL